MISDCKNAILISGCFKIPEKNDTIINSKYSYLNIMINLKQKIVEPNNMDVFIYLDYDANIPAITLNKNNREEVFNNLKIIFGSRLKKFIIVSDNDEEMKDEKKFFDYHSKIFVDKKIVS